MKDCVVPGCEWYNIYKGSYDGSFEYEQFKHREYHANGGKPITYRRDDYYAQ